LAVNRLIADTLQTGHKSPFETVRHRRPTSVRRSGDELTYRHRWSPKQLVLWYKRCVLQRATTTDLATLRRVIPPLHGAGRGYAVAG
jgi:alpha-ketoglutarate-dependent taurine dioxygenase